MVHLVRTLISAAALVTVSSAAPMVPRDSAIGEEVAVSAPNGVVLSDAPSATATAVELGGGSDNSNSYNQDSNGYNQGSYNQGSYNQGYGSSDNSYNQGYSSSDNYNQGYSSSDNYNQGYSSSDNYNQGYSSSDNSYESTSSVYETSTYDSSTYESTSTYDSSSAYETSTYDSSSSYETSAYEYTSTSSAYVSYSTPSYGSGGESWGGSGYNDCVMQCAASFGMNSATWSPPTATQDSSDSSMYGGQSGSNGVTHTIIVAPSAGVFRYVPFATNASVGDTITFKWGAGPHTVTQSSALEVCNKTDLSNPAFQPSGSQNVGFTYDYVVADSKPTWFYCGVPGHCEKGMFGGINIGEPNPDAADQGNNGYVSLGSSIVNMTSMSSDMNAMYQYTKSKTSDNAYANNWGMGINVAGMDQNAMMETAKNVLWTQTLIAANPTAVDPTKGFQVTNQNLTIPGDLSVALSSSAPANAGAAPPASGGAPAGSSPAAATPPAGAKSGAVSVASSSVALGFVTIVATFLML